MCWLLLMGLTAAIPASGKMAVVQGTTGSRCDALEVRAGGLVVREGEAGAAFGNVCVGSAGRQWSYFILFKHSLGCEGRMEWSEETATEMTGGRCKQSVAIDGKKLQVEYHVESAGDKVKESLRINDTAADLGRGRIFLVDLTTYPPTWEQRKAGLPQEVKRAATRREALEAVQQVLASLRRLDRRAGQFLADAGR